MITTQRELRRVFWAEHPELSRKKTHYGDIKSYCTDTRCAFVDWLDYMAKDGQISDKLAMNATLERR